MTKICKNCECRSDTVEYDKYAGEYRCEDCASYDMQEEAELEARMAHGDEYAIEN